MFKKIATIIVSLVFIACSVFAAGTTTQKIIENGSEGYAWIVSFTADASDGSIPDTVITGSNNNVKGCYLYQVETKPGGNAPTDNWDVVIYGADNSTDVLGGQCLNRDNSTTRGEECYPVNYYGVTGPVTMNISGNSVNSANGTVKVLFVK